MKKYVIMCFALLATLVGIIQTYATEPITISGARISFTSDTITALNGYAGDMANNYFQAYYLIPALLVVGVAGMLLNKVFGIFSFSK